MKAAQITEYGSLENIKVTDIAMPDISKDQVLIEVHASSLNPFDTSVREGYMKEMIPLTFPVTLGGDISGVVKEIGSNIQHVAIGDKVYGQANVVAGNSGAFAEFTATKGSQIAKMPANCNFLEAASLPLVGVSALQALKSHLDLQTDQKILIHGGSGGIGTIAIQIAKNIGAYVATTASGEGLERVKALGADEIIDYKTQAFDELLSNYDAVFDTVSGETYERSFKVLKPGGVIVSMLAQPNAELAEQYNVKAIAQSTHVTSESLSQLTKLVEQGVVKPQVAQTFPLEKIQDAFRLRESGGVVGKVVVSIKSAS